MVVVVVVLVAVVVVVVVVMSALLLSLMLKPKLSPNKILHRHFKGSHDVNVIQDE